MARGIVKFAEEAYCEWGTITDSPVSQIHDRARAVELWGEDRVARADAKGHSWLDLGPMTPEQVVAGNRAGEDESELSVVEIMEAYRP